MIDKKYWVIAETIMLIVWIVTLIIFLSQIWTSGTKCMASPLQYGVGVWDRQYNATMTCICSFDKGTTQELFVDKDHTIFRLKGGTQ